ncbi:hypothetical protein GA0111570_1012 [Raineyella antarctica]|uniref:Uncharacterized protein n=1 Tax=Raineyella antarctica TaxID=1577474 RepID=A0A1G6GD06_9ACTN|nr:hypothetical protein [Raineyella antarctica]SDB79733.1 hypothetical protein GA0111570_1012 [Raineyella antarctica]
MDVPDLTDRRRRTLEASRRPGWVDVVLAAGMGVTLGVASFQAIWSWIVGIILLALTITIAVVLNRSFAKRRDVPGEGLTDRRSALMFMAMYLAVFVLGQARVPHAWQPWWALAVAVIAMSGGLGYLRLTERFTIERLAGTAAPILMRECPESFRSPTRAALCACLYPVSALERAAVVEGLAVPASELDEQVAALTNAGDVRLERRGQLGSSRTWLSLTLQGRKAYAAAANQSPGR